MVKVGLVTRSSIPSPLAMPEMNAVFPAPRSPVKATTVPGPIAPASRSPSARVSSGLWVMISIA